jgi:A/G-specific adenine glycosylase
MAKQANPSNAQFTKPLLSWFKKHGRTTLPWQSQQTPYRVWISEIMLQQTQVNTVIPYYQRFMQSFPTVQKLAQVQEDNVLHHWTGLGYYARARNLHKAATIIHTEMNNKLPDTVDALCELPGIGKSTAGAIIALASKQRAVILDGNVKRVLCRYHCIEGWPDSSSTNKILWEIADRYTPRQSCAEYTQAIMDLGATLCTRSKPNCPICPLHKTCQAYSENRTTEFPNKKPKKTLPIKTTTMLMLRSTDTDKILLEKRPPQGIWGGLWSFPEIETSTNHNEFLTHHGLSKSKHQQQWQTLRHTFSHFHLDITPLAITLKKEQHAIMENQRWHWYDLQNPTELGLPTPVKNLLAKLNK